MLPRAFFHFAPLALVLGPLPTTSGFGHAMQPYPRYQLGSSTTGRQRPLVQYTFVPYRVVNYGAGPCYDSDGAGPPTNAGFAPLTTRNALYGPYNSYGGLGNFSVGIPMQVGRGTAVLSVGGTRHERALEQSLR